MHRPKSFAEINQRLLAEAVIEWDGEKKSDSVVVPLSRKPVLIAVDNSGAALSAKFEHHIRIGDANASAQIGEGDNGSVVVTVDEAGAAGNAYAISVTIPDEESADLAVDLIGTDIIVSLATDAQGEPDDAKNTATLIAAAIDELEGFSAEASGNGSGAFDEELEPVQFTGGTEDVWAQVYAVNGDAKVITIGAETCGVYGPVDMFPRFYGGRVVFSADEALDDGETTKVRVIEG